VKLRCELALSLLVLPLTFIGCGGGSSAQVQPPPPAVPTISSISPTTAAPGSPDLTLAVMGSNFVNSAHSLSRVAWSVNGSETLLATTFVSSTQLMAIVPAGLLANAGTAQVLVETGDPTDMLSKSNSVTFSISTSPLGPPSITSISPTSAVAGSTDITLNITGSNLAGRPHDVRRPVWSANGITTNLSTTFVSSNQLTAVIPASLMSSPVTAQVFIAFGDPMGDVPLSNSNSLEFKVTSAAQGATSISPSTDTLGPLGTRQFVFTMEGGNANADWVVEEGAAGGTITSTGLYAAPSGIGTYHLTATSVRDSSKYATATVTVVGSGFTTTGSMRSARIGHTATLLKDGRVLIVGGGDGTAELFDPTSGTFSITGPPRTGRLNATATLLADGRVLIAGGLGLTAGPDGFLTRLNSAEIFDAATGTFRATGSMIQTRRRHTATLLSDGRVLVAGGYSDAICTTASAELFDPATGTFSSSGTMLTERVFHTATLLKSGEVLMAGGSNGCAPDAPDDPPWDPLFVEVYDPGSGSFQAGSGMNTTRIGHAAIPLGNGKVLILGGIPALQNLHEQPIDPSYAEEYDPATHAISPVAGLTISQAKYTATLLTSGKVLIAGGVDEQGHPTSEAGLVDPASGTLATTGGPVTARVGHTATLLNDGRVLVTGGTDSSGNATASAELYK
jgi:IPT/TIG domain/Galactose oxidase, central domain